MTVKEIICKTALHYHDKEFASNWDLNLYRGCGHRCIYCFAQYSHKYFNSHRFFDDIFVKTNVVEALRTDLQKQSWNGEAVNICGVTDGYQPLEKKYRLMPEIIKTFIDYQNPLIITTKSTLLLRDIDLLEKLNALTWVYVWISVSTLNESIRKKIEPFAAPTRDRIEMLHLLRKRGIRSGILLMPVIPHLTDDDENLDMIFELTKKNGALSIIPQLLHLRGNTRWVFFQHLQEFFPHLLQKIEPLYKGAYVTEIYREKFYKKIAFLRKKYNFYSPKDFYQKNQRQKRQLQLF
jgi:DNA repair photolyase